MVIGNSDWSKPKRLNISPIIGGNYYSREEAFFKFRKFMSKWYQKDFYICCKPFIASNGQWYAYIQDKIID